MGDTDCPVGLICDPVSSLCAERESPTPLAPTLSVQSLTPSARAIDTIEIGLSVADGNEDFVGLEATYSVDGGPSLPARLSAVEDLTRFQSSATGRVLSLSWSLVEQAEFDAGEGDVAPVAFVDTDGDELEETRVISYGDEGPRSWTLTLRVFDESGLRSTPTLVGPFTVGNQPPVVSLVEGPLRGELRNQAVIEFTISDDARDLANVEVEFRPVNEFEWRTAALAFGETTELVPRTGASYAVVWDTRASQSMDAEAPQGLGDESVAVDIRVRAFDEVQGGRRMYGEWARPSFALQVINQSPPTVRDVRAPRANLVGGFTPIPITFNVSDEDSDPVDILVEYSTDDGATFTPCDESPDWFSSGRYGLATRPAGVDHTFVWSPGGDFLLEPVSLLVRVSAIDAQARLASSAEGALRRAPGLGEQLFGNSARTVGPSCSVGEPGARIRAEVNGDAVEDLVYACSGDPPVLEIYPGTATGEFESSPIRHLLSAPDATFRDDLAQWASFMDIGGVDPPKLAVASERSFTNSDGQPIQPRGYTLFQLDPAAGAPSLVIQQGIDDLLDNFGIAVGDVTGDGADDVVVQWQNAELDGIIGVSVRDGGGGFGGLIDVAGARRAEENGGIFVVQLDDDPELEIVASKIASSSNPLLVVELDEAFDGDPEVELSEAFETSTLTETPAAVRQIEAFDFTGDGAEDLILNPLDRAEFYLAPQALNNGSSGFSTPEVFATGELLPSVVAGADLNGDEVPDILVLGRQGEIAVSLAALVRGVPSGAFAPLAVSTNSGCGAPLVATFSDSNGDGVADIEFVGDCGDETALFVAESQLGAVADSAFRQFLLPAFGSVSGLIDRDLDGVVDIAGFSADDGTPVALLSDGTGRALDTVTLPANNPLRALRTLSFAPNAISLPVAANAQGLATVHFDSGSLETTLLYETGSIEAAPVACDVDGDGLSELFVPFDDGQRILASKQEVSGFSAPVSFNPTNATISSLGCGDLDENGRRDLVLVTPEANEVVLTQLSIAPEDTFPELVALRTRFASVAGVETGPLLVLDLDRDSHVDVVWASNQGASVAYGQGNGRFDPPVVTAVGAEVFPSTAVVAGDLTDDGLTDLYVANDRESSIIDGRTLVARDAPVDLGGRFAFDLSNRTVFRVSGSVSAWLGDFNRDGSLDVIAESTRAGQESVQARVEIKESLSLLPVRFVEPVVATDFNSPAALIGLAPVSGNDFFGEPLLAPTFTIRPFSVEPGLEGFDVDSELHALGLFVNARGTPLTTAVRVDGDVHVRRRFDAQGGVGRLAVELRPELSGATSVSELAIGGSPAESKGFVFELELPEEARSQPVGDLVVLHWMRDWQRANTYALDALFGNPEGADLLPQRISEDGAIEDVLMPEYRWRRIEQVNALAEGSGARFSVIDDGQGLRARILTERLGVFVVYLDPQTS